MHFVIYRDTLGTHFQLFFSSILDEAYGRILTQQPARFEKRVIQGRRHNQEDLSGQDQPAFQSHGFEADRIEFLHQLFFYLEDLKSMLKFVAEL